MFFPQLIQLSKKKKKEICGEKAYDLLSAAFKYTYQHLLYLYHEAVPLGTAPPAPFHRVTTAILGGGRCYLYFTEEELRPREVK